MSRLLEPVPCEPFQYVPHLYSVGDRYTVTLSYPDEPTLRSDLEPLGLGLAADIRLGGAYIESEGVWVDAFGPCVTLQIGPEDAYEFLQAEHHAQAARLARVFTEKEVSRFASAPFEPTHRGEFNATFSPAHARLGEHELALRERNRSSYLLRVGAPTAIGFATEVLGGPGTEAPEITDETVPLGLVPGRIGRAAITIGKRADGMFGKVVREFRELPPNAAIERYRPIFEQLEIPLPDAEEDEASLATRIVVARDGLSAATLTTPMAIVSAALTFLRDMRLPCLFDARRAVLEDRDDLFEFVIANLNASLEGDPRRFAPLGFGPDADTFVALTEAERALLRW